MKKFSIGITISILLISSTVAFSESYNVKSINTERRDDFTGEWVKYHDDFQSPPRKHSFGMSYSETNNDIYIFGGKLVFIGNDPTNDVWKFDIDNRTWMQLNNINPPHERYGIESCLVNNHLYSFGGEYNDFNETTQKSDIQFFDDTWKYSIESNTWYEINSLTTPSKRVFYSMCLNDNAKEIYIFGGYNYPDPINEPSNIEYLGDFWKFNILTEEWSEITAVGSPSNRSSSTLFYNNDEDAIYLIGGIDGSDDGRFGLSDKYRYDISLKKWEKISLNISYDNRDRTITYCFDSINKDIYLYEDIDNYFWKYNLITSSFTIIDKLNYANPPYRRYGGKMIIDKEGLIFLWGGGTPGETVPSNETWVYNTRPIAIPPEYPIPIPDSHALYEDDQESGQHLINLNTHFSDDMGPSDLRYEVTYQEDQSLLSSEVDGQYLNFTQQVPNWFGTLGFKVKAYDKGIDRIAETTDDLWVESNLFNITVLPTNDPPEILDVFGSISWEGATYETTEDVPFIGSINTTDIDGDGPHFTDDISSSGFSIGEDTGNVVFTPTSNDVGWVNGSVFLSDGNGSVQIPINLSFHVSKKPDNGEPPLETPWASLLSPPYGGKVSQTDVTLKWSTNWTGGGIVYSVYFGETDPPPEVAANHVGTEYSVSDLEDGTKYYWTVVPYYGSSMGQCSSGTWSFEIEEGFVPEYDIDWTYDNLEDMKPGDSASIAISIENLGNTADSVSVEIVSGPDWVMLSSNAVSISDGESEDMLLFIMPPFGTEAKEYAVNVKATSLGGEELLATLIVTVLPGDSNPVYDLDVSLDRESVTLKPGGSTTVNLTVTNNGNVQDSVNIEFSDGGFQWAATAENQFMLDPSESKTVLIDISVPANAEEKTYPFSVTVTYSGGQSDVLIDVVVNEDGTPVDDDDVEPDDDDNDNENSWAIPAAIGIVVAVVAVIGVVFFLRGKGKKPEVSSQPMPQPGTQGQQYQV